MQKSEGDMTISVYQFGKIAVVAVVVVVLAAGMLRTQATSHVIRQDGGSNNKTQGLPCSDIMQTLAPQIQSKFLSRSIIIYGETKNVQNKK